MSAAKLKEIEALKDLPHGWDGPGTGPPDRVSIRTAYELVRSAEGVAIRACREWEDPVVAPRPDRGIDLLWERQDRKLLLTVPMREEYQVEMQLFRDGKKTQKRRLALVEACDEVARLFEFWEKSHSKRQWLQKKAEIAARNEEARPWLFLPPNRVRWAREQYCLDPKNFGMILKTLGISRPALVNLLNRRVRGGDWAGLNFGAWQNWKAWQGMTPERMERILPRRRAKL